MLVKQKKRKLAASPVVPLVASGPAASEQEPKSPECEIFALAVVGGDGNRVTAYARLKGMTAEERRRLRESIEWLDSLLDQVALDLHLERHKSRSKSKGENNHHGNR